MKINATLSVIARGKDGFVRAERMIVLPCIPFTDMAVDGLRVLKASYETKTRQWLLVMEGYNQAHGDAKANLADLVGKENVGEWEIRPIAHPSMSNAS